MLSRGSCFAVRDDNKLTTFLFSAHVAAPYQFLDLYPNARDWLEFVRPEHVKVFVECWKDDESARTFEIGSLRKHVSRDVACGVLCNEPTDFAFNPMKLNRNVEIGSFSDIICEGHNIVDDKNVPEQHIVSGRSFFRTDHQLFLSTDDVLPHGMCGGPVISDKDNSVLLGLTEGSIPIGTISEDTHGEIGKLLHDKHGAVCIESRDLYDLIMEKDGCFEYLR